ncbi:MAG: ABC-F family ATP-binding cassette domain-containing protein, partial [Clostridiales bacterium]|nr:ABC-F family ATP-binding cassette domain-containing protein [Clostridiales bacterium]
MILLSMQNIQKSFGGKQILKNISFTLQDQHKTGIIGLNGSGKSTLFNIISGKEVADEGTFTLAKDTSIGYLEQHTTFHSNDSIFNTLKELFTDVFEIENKMRSVEREMTSCTTQSELAMLGERYHGLTQAFEDLDGYAWESNLTGVLLGLGFKRDQFHQSVSTLSGGEQARLQLAAMLLKKPTLLLLDEPTNHLD